ncbi:MAG: sensor histidine kinase [Actinomycetales bacterium]|nr:sensor histidine kinase [Actinomycetales bacterium]
MTMDATVSLQGADTRPDAFTRLVIERLHDRRFWLVQVAILAITTAHGIAEVTGTYHADIADDVGLQHLLVLLYVIPVAFAGLRFGLEGGFLAGVSATFLAVPNLLIYHLHNYEWVAELMSMVVVIGVGLAVAVPVERERWQRRRAEETSGRLALLNGIAEMLAEAREPEAALGDLLDRLSEAIGLDAVAVVVADPPVVAVRGSSQAAVERLRDAVAHPLEEVTDAHTIVLPFHTEGPRVGVLTVQAGRALSDEERALLAAVAHHIALELENAQFQRNERERLEGYARTVLAAQEAERARVARDLHDDVAQPLVQLSRGLGEFRDVLGARPDVVGRAEELRTLSLSTLALVRGFSHHLRPPTLDDLGLIPAVANLVRDHGDRCHIAVAFEVVGVERRLRPETEVAAFRIVQEALRNVEKHAGASRAWVRLRFDGGGLSVRVDDDGCGFDAGSNADGNGGGMGLEEMRERAQLEGGTFRIARRAGPGTRVDVVLAA